MGENKDKPRYTCNDYREEMILAGLHKRLLQANLSEDERRCLLLEIEKLEEQMGL